jgi:hypothetical protein
MLRNFYVLPLSNCPGNNLLFVAFFLPPGRAQVEKVLLDGLRPCVRQKTYFLAVANFIFKYHKIEISHNNFLFYSNSCVTNLVFAMRRIPYHDMKIPVMHTFFNTTQTPVSLYLFTPHADNIPLVTVLCTKFSCSLAGAGSLSCICILYSFPL